MRLDILECPLNFAHVRIRVDCTNCAALSFAIMDQRTFLPGKSHFSAMQWDATVNGRVAIPVNRSSALGTIGGGWGEREGLIGMLQLMACSVTDQEYCL